MNWVIESAPLDLAQGEYLVLLMLANHAHSDGTAAFPYRDVLARESRMSRRATQENLRKLEAKGLIEQEEWPGTDKRDARYRPIRWRFPEVQNPHLSRAPRGAGRRNPGVQIATSRGADRDSVRTEPSLEPSLGTVLKPFDRFWSVYPRREDKGGSRKAFERAVAKVGAEAVIAGAERLAADPNLPEKQFIPHPSKWLNAERWDDDPLPSRNGQGNLDRIIAQANRLIEKGEPSG